MNKNGNVPIT